MAVKIKSLLSDFQRLAENEKSFGKKAKNILKIIKTNYDFNLEKEQTLERYISLIIEYKKKYRRDEAFIARAPGRINLIGEHTDYNGCPVLPMAVNRDFIAAFYTRNNREIVLNNINPCFEERRFVLEERISPYQSGDWGNYCKAGIQGMIDYYKTMGKSVNDLKGIDIMLSGNIPPAAGMSSSSALVVISALILSIANKIAINKRILAQLMAKAEHYVGTQGGGMDQATSLLGKSGHALKIDFNPFDITLAKMVPGYAVIVANSLVHAGKTQGAMDHYNLRAIECRLATSLLRREFSRRLGLEHGINLIGDLKREKLCIPEKKILEIAKSTFHENPYSLKEISCILNQDAETIAQTYCKKRDGSIFKEPAHGFKLFKRFHHIFSEWKRVEQSLLEFKNGNVKKFGALMDKSHESCRDNYEISCAELDRLVEIARENGALGSRLTGAGFGGCTVSLVKKCQVPSFIEKTTKAYYGEYLKEKRDDYSNLIFACKAVNGAGLIF
ncbi:MAG: galactokinase [Elusimicrobiota bacterium]